MPSVLLMTSYSPWLFPEDMHAVVHQVMTNPAEIGIEREALPIAIAALSWKTVQEIWLCDHACAAIGIDAAFQDRIRRAIRTAFVERADGQLLSERQW